MQGVMSNPISKDQHILASNILAFFPRSRKGKKISGKKMGGKKIAATDLHALSFEDSTVRGRIEARFHERSTQ
jgi:hypothetical protein